MAPTQAATCGSFAILHGACPHFSDCRHHGRAGSEHSFAALSLNARPVWSQRIMHAKKLVTMGSSSRAVAGARAEGRAKLWMSDFGR
jgi:hypothetical protein